MHQYLGAGLDNVYLKNGYTLRKYGNEKVVAVEDVEGLHRAIAAKIIGKTNRMTGAEFRFLRIEMDLSQNMLGQMFGVSDQTIASWEKGVTKEVSGAGERLMRLLAEEALLKREGVICNTLAKLAELDRQNIERMVFMETTSGWTAEAA